MATGRSSSPSYRRTFIALSAVTIGGFVLFCGIGMGNVGVALLGLLCGVLIAAAALLTGVRQRRPFVPGSAYVREVNPPPVGAGAGRCELHLLLSAPGVEGVAVRVRDAGIPVAKWPTVGTMLPVEVAQGNARRVRIRWDEVPVRPPGTRVRPGAATRPPGTTGPGTPDPVPGFDDAATLTDLPPVVYSPTADFVLIGATPAADPPTAAGTPSPGATDSGPDTGPDAHHVTQAPPPRRKPSPYPRHVPRHAAPSPEDSATTRTTEPSPEDSATTRTAEPASATGDAAPADEPARPADPAESAAPAQEPASPGPTSDHGPAGPAVSTGVAEATGASATAAPGADRARPARRRPSPRPRPGESWPRPRTAPAPDPVRATTAWSSAPSAGNSAPGAASAPTGATAGRGTTTAEAPDIPAQRDGRVHGASVTLIVSDVPRSLEFYQDKLGLTVLDRGHGSAVLASGTSHVVLRQVAQMPRVDRRVMHLNLAVPDVDVAYERLRALGVEFTHRPRTLTQGEALEQRGATCRDPDGHAVALIQWRPRTPADSTP